MKAAVIREYGKISTEERDEPLTGENQVLVKVNYASICGSDQHLFKGEFEPRTSLPLVPGHEFAGDVAGTGSKVNDLEKGDKVTVDPIIWCGECPACRIGHYPACDSLRLIGIDLDGGFSEYIAVDRNMVWKIPEGVNHRHAALIEVLSIGFHASKRAGLGKNDNVAIWGAGKVGQSILQAVKTITEGKVFIVDPVQERLDIARSAYPDIYAVNNAEEDEVSYIRNKLKGGGVDVAFEAVGHYRELPGRYNPIRSCIQSIRGAGKVCVLGLSDQPSDLVMKELIWKEALIISSRVSHGEFEDAIDALERKVLKPDFLITDELPLDEIQKGFDMLEEEPEKHLKVLLKVQA